MSQTRSKISQPSLPAKVTPARVASLAERVSNAYDQGNLACNNAKHYFANAPAFQLQSKRPQDILGMMMPGDKAKCRCEMSVMERAWNDRFFQKDGVFTSRYVERGSYTLGVADKKANGRRVRHLQFSLSSAELDILHADFRTLWFIPGDDNHDHPIAHIRTMLCAERLVDKLPVSTDPEVPKHYLDLHGNPARNAGFNRRRTGAKITTVVELVSPADAVRKAFKWAGHPYLETSMRSLSVAPDPAHTQLLDSLDGSLSVHTLYYYDVQEVCAHVNRTGKPLVALMHRFQGQQGSMNNGEQTWTKSKKCGVEYITQTNVLTGESYSHPDNSSWFNTNNWAPKPRIGENGLIFENGMAWSTNIACEGTYELVIVPCPGRNCSVGDQHGVEDAVQSKSAVNNRIAKNQSYELVADGESMPLCIDAPKTFAEARAIIAGKPRNEEKWPDHLASVKRIASKNKESTDNIVDVAMASFFIDFTTDARKLGTVLVSNKTERRSFSRVLSGKNVNETRSIVRDILCTAGVVVALVGSQPNKVAHGLINHTVDLLDQRT